MPGHITVGFRSEATIIGTCENLVLIFADASPAATDIAAFTDITTELARRWPSGIGLLLIANGDASPPSAEARRAITDAIRTASPSILGFAAAIVGEGFGVAAIRSIFAALMMAARNPFQSKSFPDVAGALGWLTRELDGKDRARIDTASLLKNAERLRRGSLRPGTNTP